MAVLIIGLVIFFAVHLLTAKRDWRDAAINKLGEGGYKGLYSVISLIGFGLLVYGYSIAEFTAIWHPPVWTRHVTFSLMPVALILLAATYIPNNLRRLTAHPMLWAVTLWAAAHLIANGDLASILLFGSFAVYSVFAMLSQTARGATRSATKRPITGDIAVVVIGIAATGLIMKFHGTLFGMPLVGG